MAEREIKDQRLERRSWHFPHFLQLSLNLSMAFLNGQNGSPLEFSHRVWEDPSFFKWGKRDAHVPLCRHDTVEGI
ncbi:hypothetical protein Ancab_017207 [Ancistrocladus abbreviatus]